MSLYFRTMAGLFLFMGAVFFVLLAIDAFRTELTPLSRFLVGLSMLFGGIANAFFLTVLNRLHVAGYEVGVWRTFKDFGFYSDYWKIAPTREWPRWHLSAAIAATVVSLISMLIVVARLGK